MLDRKPGMRRTACLGVALCIAALATRVQATPAELWATNAAASCEGLTLGWTPPLGELSAMLRAGMRPAAGPVKGHGLLLLFVVTCQHSSIGRYAAGRFTLAALIVPILRPVDGYGIPVSNARGWAVIPEVMGSRTNPVLQLFSRQRFRVTHAAVTFVVDKTPQARKVTVSIMTSQGRIKAWARVSGPAKRFRAVSALLNDRLQAPSVFDGPESAVRWDHGISRVSIRGDTWVSRLRLDSAPNLVMLDEHFIWSFLFSHPEH